MRGGVMGRILVAAAGAFLAAGCVTVRSVPETGTVVVRPGDEFRWKDERYRLVAVQEDFVFLRYVRPEGVKGEISGWVKEVFRVGRYDLGEGQWTPRPELEGLAVQWRGGEEFALSGSGGGEPGPGEVK